MSIYPTSKSRFSIPLDIYPPEPLLAEDDSSLVVIILQGVGIDKSEYAAIAKKLSYHQLWVVVPNCYPEGRDYICPENNSTHQVITALESEASQPLYQALQRGVILLGHSAGGMAALGGLNEMSHLLDRLVAIATYGSNAPFNISATRSLPPVLMLSGEKDSIVPSDISRTAFYRIPMVKTFIELKGLNHYSINNSLQPIDAPPEENQADFPHSDSIHFITCFLTSFVQAVKSQDQNWLSALERDVVRAINYQESIWTVDS